MQHYTLSIQTLDARSGQYNKEVGFSIEENEEIK